MAIKVKEAEKIVRIAKERKKNLTIPFRFQSSPEAQSLKRSIDQEELGEIYYAQSSWVREKTVFKEKDFWFTREDKSEGGCLIDIGVCIRYDYTFAYLYNLMEAIAEGKVSILNFGLGGLFHKLCYVFA